MSEHPQAVCGLAFDLVQRLSPIVRQIDFALDWMELEAGRALYKCVRQFQLIIVGYTSYLERPTRVLLSKIKGIFLGY